MPLMFGHAVAAYPYAMIDRTERAPARVCAGTTCLAPELDPRRLQTAIRDHLDA